MSTDRELAAFCAGLRLAARIVAGDEGKSACAKFGVLRGHMALAETFRVMAKRYTAEGRELDESLLELRDDPQLDALLLVPPGGES